MKESHVHLTGLWKLGLSLSHEHHYPGLKQKGLHAQHAYRQSQKQERFFALRTESVSGELNLLQLYAVVQHQSEWNGKESHACLTCFRKLGLLLPHALGWNRQVQSELNNSESHLIWHVITSWVCLWHLWFTPPSLMEEASWKGLLSLGAGGVKYSSTLLSFTCTCTLGLVRHFLMCLVQLQCTCIYSDVPADNR